MKRAFSMNNTACAACGYLVLIGFAFTLSGCVAPYYAARPAPVYFPLYGRSAGYAPQAASIYYGAASTGSVAYRERFGKAQARPARRGSAEQTQTSRGREGEGAGWIDPAP